MTITLPGDSELADNRFAYFEHAAGPRIEISEISGITGRLFAHIAEVAASWDGSAPIRSL